MQQGGVMPPCEGEAQMSLQVSKFDVWQGQVPDKPGTLGQGLADLAKAGVDLDFALGRPDQEPPGQAIVFVSPLKGAKQTEAAAAAGFRKSTQIQGIRVVGADRPGLAGEVAAALGAVGVNILGFHGVVLGKQVAIHVFVDAKEDVTKALRAIRKEN
jgi:predicted amino acid-binding ACT domain protein